MSLKVRKGEIFVIMGLSGSGKSTLVRCMTGLHALTAGHMLIDGLDLAQLSDADLVHLRRRKISMVFQDFALLPHLTVLGNVAFPLRVQGIGRQAREDTALRMIELVGLKGRESYYPDELSGGQQQRVGIARSLTTQPDVWFLDEPFSALDPLIRRDMQTEFLRLQSMLTKTIVFITHDFDEAVRLADRMAVMKDGRIVQIGRPEDLILSPADEYIENFTRNIPKNKVLRVRSIMDARTAPNNDVALPAEACLCDVAERVITGKGHHPVVDAEGTVVGALHRSDLAQYLV
ncbi:ATP-binding cassette domain-containing protein [Tropicimonas marinistellae]|uniref:ATP-binding cassette domain-containing protein n=1 Tax=Tropicimonas marinistellae TaxID=1739787 RepID=UPI001F332FBC|nr:ATP-binding cassette domain-containing protein [Tropicimonas marinistellae]